MINLESNLFRDMAGSAAPAALVIAVAVFLFWIDGRITKYDEKLKKKKSLTKQDRLIDTLRWVLFVPAGLFAATTFAVLLALLTGWYLDRLGDNIYLEVFGVVLYSYFAGYCFYKIMPPQDKRRRMQNTLIAVLGLSGALVVTTLMADRDLDSAFIANIIVAVIALYFLISPSKQPWLRLWRK